MENETRKPFDSTSDMRAWLDRIDEAAEGKVSARQAMILAFSNMPDPKEKYQAGALVEKLEEMGVFWTEFKGDGVDVHGNVKGKGDMVRRFRCNMLANQGTVVIKEEPKGYFRLVPELIQEPGVPAPAPASIPGPDPEPVVNQAMDAVDAVEPTDAKVVVDDGKAKVKVTGAKKKPKKKTEPAGEKPAAAAKPKAKPAGIELKLATGEMGDMAQVIATAPADTNGIGQLMDMVADGGNPEGASLHVVVNGRSVDYLTPDDMNFADKSADEVENSVADMIANAKKASESAAPDFADFVMEFSDEAEKFTDTYVLNVDASNMDGSALAAVNDALRDYVSTQ